MSNIRTIQYDSEKEYVICTTKQKLSRCVIFEKIFKKMYPKEYLGILSGYSTSDDTNDIDNHYLYNQDIVVLNEKHINVINSIGLDALPSVNFSIIPKNMIFYIENKSGYLTINEDRYIIKKLVNQYNIDLKSLKRELYNEIYTSNIKNSIKNIIDIYESEEDM